MTEISREERVALKPCPTPWCEKWTPPYVFERRKDTRGKRRISPESLKRDLEIIEQFERELKEGKHDKRGG